LTLTEQTRLIKDWFTGKLRFRLKDWYQQAYDLTVLDELVERQIEAHEALLDKLENFKEAFLN